MKRIHIATTLLSYLLFGVAVYMGTTYEVEGNGLHPALAAVCCLLSITASVWSTMMQASSNEGLDIAC